MEQQLEFEFMSKLPKPEVISDDQNHEEVAASAFGRFEELMDDYNVKQEDREEIAFLARWF